MTSKHIGIINFSTNCYLNVIIQLFLFNKETSNIIVNYLNFVSIDNKKCINPQKLMKILSSKIDTSKQNDSQEIFIEILDQIKELEPFYENEIQNIFTCQECNKSRKVKDVFSTFYIHENSIEDSIKKLTITESFDLECDYCKNLKVTKTNKNSKIVKLGKVLIFYNINKNELKISENILFNKNKYKLSGFIKHFGNKNSGHYIFIDYINKVIIDDTNITTFEKIDLNNIYLLFYTL
jgi:ubiquitin C-terminal hydrolase